MRYLFLLVLIVLTGCALPVSTTDTAGYVPTDDIRTVGLVRQGLSYYKQSRFMDAELSLRQALYLFPDADNIKTNLGLTLAGSKNTDEAFEIQRQLVQKYPRSTKHFINLAHTYVKAGDYGKAVETFEHAYDLAIDANDVNTAGVIARNLAVIAFTVGQEEQAECRSAEALVFRPGAQELGRHLKQLVAIGRYRRVDDEGLEFLNALPPDQQDPEILRLIAVARFGLENFAGSGEIAQRGVDRGGLATDLAGEFSLLVFLSEKHTQIDTAVPLTERPELKEGSPLLAYLEGIIDQSQLLYWPPNLIKEYLDLQQQLKDQGMLT